MSSCGRNHRSPAASGTSFSITQTEPNPQFTLDAATVGFIAGIGVAPEAFNQDIGSVGFVGTFSPVLGTLTDQFSGETADIVGFNFYFDNDVSLYRPILNLDSIILQGSNQTHHLLFSNGTTSAIGIDFSRFVLGTYVENDPMFGKVTTVVIPEPSSIILASIGSGFLLFRRRATLSK